VPGAPAVIEHSTTLGRWRLTRASPDAAARHIVHEYWEVEGRLSPFREALLPNGFVEIMFNLGPPHRVFEGAGAGLWTECWYSGLQERAIFIESLEGTHLVSARLSPIGAVSLLGFGAPRAANTIVQLDTLIGPAARTLLDTMTRAGTPQDRFEALEAFVAGRTARIDVPAFVQQIVAAIDEAHGNLRVSTLHEMAGVSRKHLTVSFTRFVGMSMKAYANMRRFLWTLEQLGAHATIEWSQLAASAGYSDQAHLARDFRRVGAASPTEYLRKMAPDGDALVDESPR
jgi:AraC-like DNA-binding protein